MVKAWGSAPAALAREAAWRSMAGCRPRCGRRWPWVQGRRNDTRKRGPWRHCREEEATVDWIFVIFVALTVVMVAEALGMSFIRR